MDSIQCPFFIGQEVVTVDNWDYHWTKGEIKTILGIRQGVCEHSAWLVDVGVQLQTGCYICGLHTHGHWFRTSHFAPIEKQSSFQKVEYSKILEDVEIGVN